MAPYSGLRCSVESCTNSIRKAKKEGKLLRFFSFPKNIELRKTWIKMCHRKDRFNVSKARICSSHFKPEDFEDRLSADFRGLQPKLLKKDAVPSLFLQSGESAESSLIRSERSTRALKRERKKLVEDLLQNKENVDTKEAGNGTIKQRIQELELVHTQKTKGMDSDILKQKIAELERENALLKEKVEILEINNNKIKEKVNELEKNFKKDDACFEERLKVALNEVLTPNQVEIILKKKTKAHWTTEELAKALTLRFLSKRSYVYLRQNLKYPLPGISTLQRWASNIDLRKGILHDVLRIMGTAGQTKNKISKVSVISFDEMKVCSMYEFCEKDDEIVGPHAYMQVIMCRGLFDKWKQPIYLGFDQKVTKELLNNIIIELHKIDYNVVACTSDCGTGNQGLWRDIGVTMDNPIMEHPMTKKPIYFFADVPHLLKLLRNWFIDTGFILSNGTKVTKSPIQCLIDGNKSEINSCHKLKPLHINCEKNKRQNVRLAAELFSNTTATALKHYLPGDDKIAAQKSGEFIQLVNNWFDIMNSYTLASNVPTKKPYGVDLQMQNEELDNMLTVIKGMLCVGKKTLQVFQKGIVMSTTSLKGLYDMLKQEYGIKFVLTHRLNQDCLENLFSQIRTRGGLHDHPSPLNAVYRIRMILLGKNPGLVQSHSNVNTSAIQDEQYLVSSTIKQAKLGNIEVPSPFVPEQNKINDSSECGSLTSSSSTSTQKEEIDQDGLVYIAGYLAKKHKKHHYLGKYTYENRQEHTYAIPSWIEHLSFGGLIQPSEEWKQQVYKMDQYFLKLHKETFAFKKDIMWKTTKFIKKKMGSIAPELCRSFCRQRIFIRIKYLNLKNETKKAEKRKTISEAEGRKLSKKLRKICT